MNNRFHSTQRQRWTTVSLTILLMIAAAGFAQWQRDRRRAPRRIDRSDYPTWQIDTDYKDDVFTFVRIRYDSWNGGWGRGGSRWQNDYPDSDLNFSFRLQQLTSLKVDPNGKVLRLTDPEIFDYPFLYMNGVGGIALRDDEAVALRRYLLNGGFLMVDDFWGYAEWNNVVDQLSKVLPDKTPWELPLSHEIFHVVYDLKQKPQVPSIRHWRYGRTYEDHGPGSDTGPNFQGIVDDHGRLVVLLCHNNDVGDGWEREGEDADYFHQCSEKWSYPMGINIISYVMTH